MDMSDELVQEYRQKLWDSDICMLPSYTTTLPTGKERGEYLALDIEGPTLRIAWVQLLGSEQACRSPLKLCKVQTHPIDGCVRALEGVAFFDWVAIRIKRFVVEHDTTFPGLQKHPVQIGMAWSFPIQQTSSRSGNILPMGKGFRATQCTEGRDLGDLISQACARVGCAVDLRAIINDGDATLLAQAYVNPATRLSLVVGTGTNAAVLLLLLQLSDRKTAGRHPSWCASAESVLVHTEVSMFGKQPLPVSKWDRQLNDAHALPDFQPLEYLTTGRYLGEIVRIVLVDAISTAGLFGAELPECIAVPYSLDTKTIAALEMDSSPDLDVAKQTLLRELPTLPVHSLEELRFIREVAVLVSDRATLYMALALHALWRLFISREHKDICPSLATSVTVACTGTILERYPAFLKRCQRHAGELCSWSDASVGGLQLELAIAESTLLGAAVGACLNAQL